ncbi:SseB family protein [Trueperella bernardiae]|uniref:SseB family protein n=1 Tax=Trueperella bernardiae TaxID=59561 RepID=UPI0025575DE1|nr:SseB family protein [Trueperella bernardiae]WIM07138.1 SseB family protein [Trueperella bernardiae]
MADLRRILSPNPFADDDGSITPELAAAYAEPEHARVAAIVAALGRVIVPVLPHAHPGRDGAGIAAHAPAPTDPLECPDEDLVRVEFPGGRQALPIFSSASALRAWNDEARPVPVEVAKVASAALERADGVLVLDPGKDQTWLGRSATAALASNTPWVAPWDDPEIPRRITLGIDGYLPGLEKIGVQPGQNGSAVVVLYLIPPVDRDKVVNIAHTVAAAMGSDPYVKSRLDVVEIRPFFAGA